MRDSFERLRKDPGFQALFQAARHRDVRKNRIVIAEGEQPGLLYFLASGMAEVRSHGSRDKELLLTHLHAGDFFGEMCLFPGLATRSARVKTCTECSLLEIDYQRFLELTAQHSSLWLALAGQLAERLRGTNQQLAETPMLHASERLWQVLLGLAQRIGPSGSPYGVPVRMTRQDLGKRAGCSRELAGIALKDFARTGRVALRGRTVFVPTAALAA